MTVQEKHLLSLISKAKNNARPDISKYYVAAVGLTHSGKILFGNNIEFKGLPLCLTVHAEQSLAVQSFMTNDRLEKIAISAEPCGHCRQFLNEISGAKETLKIIVPGKTPKYLGKLLPEPFGPDNLNVRESIYGERDNKLKLRTNDGLVRVALFNANRSYAPYTKSYSGAAILMKDGIVYGGFYVENVAFNPSIQPLTAAVIKLVSEKRSLKDIKEVVLVEKKNAQVKHADISTLFISSIAPKAKFRVVLI